MKTQHKLQIAIIGAGVAGIASLNAIISDAALSKRVQKIFLFDSNQPGKSTPYSHQSKELLMNTSAGVNSIIHNRPNHFYHWLKENHLEWKGEYPNLQDVKPSTFVPRRLYGDYLADVVRQLTNRAKKKGITVEWIASNVSKIYSNGQEYIYTETGLKFEVDSIIVASGKISPDAITYSHLQKTPRYLTDPYLSVSWYQDIDVNAKILIVGNRLAAIDSFRLLQEHGHKGTVELASRNSSFPAIRKKTLPNKELIKFYQQFHTLSSLAQNFSEKLTKQQSSSFFVDLKMARQNRIGWQNHVMPFIFRARELWLSETKNEKQRFLNFVNSNLTRFISSFPFELANQLLQSVEHDKLEITTGLENILYDKNKHVYIAKYNKKPQEDKEFDYVINATNLGLKTNHFRKTLLKASKGFHVNEDYRLINNPNILVVGLATSEFDIFINAIFSIVPQVHHAISCLSHSMTTGGK